MPKRKYKNPVNNYFIYNYDIHKSTCKICYFDMAGRQNLMRHLKRKHPATYGKLMIERQRRRSANRPHQTGKKSATDSTTVTSSLAAAAGGPLSSMFKFETEPHKLFIKSEKLTFRLDEPGQQPQQMPMSKTCSNSFDDDEDAEDPTPIGQFESVFLGKTELRDSHLNDFYELITYQDSHAEEDPLIITNLTQNISETPANTFSSSDASCSNPDDAFFLQYLGNKFGKYSKNTRNMVQFYISRILYKADMGYYENGDVSKLFDADI
ncbi:uncharacterized protein LOC132789881 [Drosophila nasuta]|uniref:uncharacterized protein LOC132789881 n=1 Tax=Drosophila nasuta TaxID=42062 RepID=UPI00295EF016|nr:uncharacterized protein LOC132789881 [Drosophila nasuta]